MRVGEGLVAGGLCVCWGGVRGWGGDGAMSTILVSAHKMFQLTEFNCFISVIITKIFQNVQKMHFSSKHDADNVKNI